MKKLERVNELLNKACGIIISLEHNADKSLQKEINVLFNQIRYMDELDDLSADEEAQDWDTFGERKI
jgi:hypothetical protein